MATKHLNILPQSEENTLLYALSSNEKAVRLVWSINKDTPFDFFRTHDLIVSRQRKDCHFIHYIYEDEIFEIHYSLYKNQCDGALLVPELNNIPFFIQVTYNEQPPEKQLFSILNKPELGQLCFSIKPEQLKPATRNLLNI